MRGGLLQRLHAGDQPTATAISGFGHVPDFPERAGTSRGVLANHAREFDEKSFDRYTALAYAPEVDLFIRTGGEVRISNFLLWQIAYAELVFTDCLWPDFGAQQIDEAIASFAKRDRRFGGIRETSPAAAAVDS